MVDKLESTKDFRTDGLTSPLSFSATQRHSPSSVLVLRSDARGGKFDRVSDPIPVTEH